MTDILTLPGTTDAYINVSTNALKQVAHALRGRHVETFEFHDAPHSSPP